MILALLLLASSEAALRQMIAETALAQAKKATPDWHPQQRDCAGLIRHSYRSAFRAHGDQDNFNGFADAETLIQRQFVSVKEPKNADLLAFKNDDDWHLMLLVQAEDKAKTDALVVYSPGNGTDEVRVGTLRELESKAPAEWRPLPSNPRFLGYFRYKEWVK